MKLLKALLLSLIFVACSGSQKIIKQNPSKPEFDKEAMQHVINGGFANLLGSPKDAIYELQLAAQKDTSSAGILHALAEDYFRIGEVDAAITIVQKALTINSKHISSWELLIACYEHKKEYEKSMLALDELVKLTPNDLENRYFLISKQINAKKFQNAFENFQILREKGIDDIQVRMQVAYLFMEKKAYSFAEKIYADIQQDEPNDENVYLALATTCKARQDTVAAIEWYKKALKKNPGFNEVKAELWVHFEKNQQWDDLAQIYQNVLLAENPSVSDKIQLARIYYYKQDTLKSIQTFEKIVKDHPDIEQPYLALGALLKASGDSVATENLYHKALETNVEFYNVRKNLKDQYVQQNQIGKAIELYEPLIEVDSTVVEGTLEMAYLYIQKQDTSSAINLIKPLLESHPEDWRVSSTLGRFYLFQNRLFEAIVMFEQTLKLEKKRPHVWIFRGLAYLEMNQGDQALQNFQDALEFVPDDPDINYYLGTIYSRRKEFKKALTYLNKSLEHDPTNDQTALSLAGAYDELKQFDISEEIYQKLLQNNPNSPLIMNNYAYHLSVRGVRLQEALAFSQKALAAEPTNSPYLDTMGWIYYQMGEYENAKSYIQESIRFGAEKSAEVWEHLGDVYYKLDDPESAQKHWQKAYDLDSQKSYLLEKIEKSAE